MNLTLIRLRTDGKFPSRIEAWERETSKRAMYRIATIYVDGMITFDPEMLSQSQVNQVMVISNNFHLFYDNK